MYLPKSCHGELLSSQCTHLDFYIHIMYNVWNQFSIFTVHRRKRIAKYTQREYWRKHAFVCVQTGGRKKPKATAKKEAAKPKE